MSPNTALRVGGGCAGDGWGLGERRGEAQTEPAPEAGLGWRDWEMELGKNGAGAGEPCTGDLGSDWIREEPVLGIAPAQPSCETLAKGQLPPFLDLVKA